MHPGWALTIWDDTMICDIQIHNRKLFEASTNYGMKSDILRYEVRYLLLISLCLNIVMLQILYQHGGVYVDTDYECMSSLNRIINTCSFFVGMSNCDVVEVNNGLMG
jgi:inositol phosphorylceramide mannosyltransferase catalytic subunit